MNPTAAELAYVVDLPPGLPLLWLQERQIDYTYVGIWAVHYRVVVTESNLAAIHLHGLADLRVIRHAQNETLPDPKRWRSHFLDPEDPRHDSGPYRPYRSTP